MGLDMYLQRKYYAKNWEHTEDKEKHFITITKENFKENFTEDKEKHFTTITIETAIPTDKIVFITTEEIRWRKANAIHKWFVDTVQDGVDDCETYCVTNNELKSLLSTIEEILEDNSKASKLLPTTEGFFFGGTGYNEDYFEKLRFTKTKLSKLLSPNSEHEDNFYYTSSW